MPTAPLSRRPAARGAFAVFGALSFLTVACDGDDAALLTEVTPRATVIEGLVTPGPVAADGADLVARARTFESALADYRTGDTGGVSTLDPVAFAVDVSAAYNVNYGDLAAELPQQVTVLRTIALDDPAAFTPADAVRVESEVRDFVREVTSRYDADAVRVRYVRVAPAVLDDGRLLGFNAYVNAGVPAERAIAGLLPWSTAFRTTDDQVDCAGEIGVDDYIDAQQNLAIARQLREDADLPRGGRVIADFAGAALVTPAASFGTEFRGATLDADTLLYSLRYARVNGGEGGEPVAPDYAGDYPEAGQYLIHFDQRPSQNGVSGEVCMSEDKARQYARDYTAVAEAGAADAWRVASGNADAGVRRVASYVSSSYSLGEIERTRSHVAGVVFGTPYVIRAPSVGRVP